MKLLGSIKLSLAVPNANAVSLSYRAVKCVLVLVLLLEL